MKAEDSHEKLDEDKAFCAEILRMVKEAAGEAGSFKLTLSWVQVSPNFYPRPIIQLSVREDG